MGGYWQLEEAYGPRTITHALVRAAIVRRPSMQAS